jgi:hypothetical protein
MWPSAVAIMGRGEPSQPQRRCGRGEPCQSRRRCGRGEPSPGADVTPARLLRGGDASEQRLAIGCGRSHDLVVCLRNDRSRPADIETWNSPPLSATGLGSPRRHPCRDWLGSPLTTSAPGLAGLAPAHICAGTGWARPRPHLRHTGTRPDEPRGGLRLTGLTPFHICPRTGTRLFRPALQ